MTALSRDGQESFLGGLNTTADPFSVRPDQMRRADEARLTTYGAVVKRGGTQRTTAAVLSGAGVLGCYGWTTATGAYNTLAVCNGKLYSAQINTLPATFSSYGATLSTSARGSFAQFRGAGGTEFIYYADGGLLNKFDGTTLTENIASTGACTAIAVHNARLWGVGDTSAPDAVFYSALNNGDTLGVGASSGGQINVRTFASSRLVGLASLGSSLLLFHERGVSHITGYGDNDLTVAPQVVAAALRVCGPHAIAVADATCFALTRDGLFAVSETGAAAVATPDKPDPTISLVRALTATDLAKVRLLYVPYRRELWAWIPGSGVYSWHLDLAAWAGPWTGWVTNDCLSWALSFKTDGTPIPVRGDTNGYVLLADQTTPVKDDVLSDGTGGSKITLAVTCRRVTHGDASLTKGLRYGWILRRLKGSTGAQVSWQVDSDTGSAQLGGAAAGNWDSGSSWDSGTWDADEVGSQRVDMWGTGRTVDVTITDDGNALPEFSSILVDVLPIGRRG